MPDDSNGLKRQLGLWDAVMIVVGNVIGVGIFTTTGFIAQEIGDAWHVLAVWVLGGGLTLLGALSYGELGSAFPRAGGDYVYLREAYGPLAGFLVGWIGFFIINPGSIAALALGLGAYLLPLVHGDQAAAPSWLVNLIGLAVILAFSTLNYFSVRWTSRVQNFVGGLSLATILMLVAVGFVGGQGRWEHFSLNPGAASLADLFGPAMVSVFFTYSGWFVSAYVASEMIAPQKTLPRSLIISSLIITLVYVAVNVIYIYALPLSEMAGVVDIARRAGAALFSPAAARILAAAVMLAILSSLNSVILTAPRIYYAMARDGLFPRRLARSHPSRQTPHWAIASQALVSCAMVLVGNFYQLLSFTAFFMLLTSIATAGGVIVLRMRRPDLPRPYQVWGYPFTTLLFLCAYAWIAARVFMFNPRDALIGLAIAISGVPAYLLRRRRMKHLGIVEERVAGNESFRLG